MSYVYFTHLLLHANLKNFELRKKFSTYTNATIYSLDHKTAQKHLKPPKGTRGYFSTAQKSEYATLKKFFPKISRFKPVPKHPIYNFKQSLTKFNYIFG